MTDSILGESDWLNDQSLGLENSIWECLSDKGKLGLNQPGPGQFFGPDWLPIF